MAPGGQNQPQQAWEVLSATLLLDSAPWLRVSREHVRLPNGVEIEDFYRVDIPAYVKIFALTPDQKVVMVENYRHGPQLVSLELPAGKIEPDKTPLETAQRELLEETGMVAADWMALQDCYIDGNRGCGWVYGFLARHATYRQPPELEETEILQVVLTPVAELRQWWQQGKIKSVSSVALIGLALAHLEDKP